VLAYKRRVDAREAPCFGRLAVDWRFATVPRRLFDPGLGEGAGGGKRLTAIELADVHLLVAVRRGYSRGAAGSAKSTCDASGAVLEQWQSELRMATRKVAAAASKPM
jgi:hypothetical protein